MHERVVRPGQRHRVGHPAQQLQRAIGNRAMGQILARKKGDEKKNVGTYEESVTIGKLGPIEVKSSNIDAWIGKKDDAFDLELTTHAGKLRAALERLAEGKGGAEKLVFNKVVGENTMVTVTFTGGRIKGFKADGDTEHWRLVDLTNVDIKRLSIGKAR